MCIDALENVGPEDWPVVLRGLAMAARSGASLYVTVELTHPDELRKANEAARVAGRPVVEGELDDGVGYHYYPSRARVLRWLRDAGLTIGDEAEADDYWHLLLERASS